MHEVIAAHCARISLSKTSPPTLPLLQCEPKYSICLWPMAWTADAAKGTYDAVRPKQVQLFSIST